MKLNDIIVKPLLTEKGTESAQKGVYMFEVQKLATKDHIAEAIEKLYTVTVSGVKVSIRKGKTRRVGRKMGVKLVAPRKIAYIRVSKGTIDVFPKT